MMYLLAVALLYVAGKGVGACETHGNANNPDSVTVSTDNRYTYVAVPTLTAELQARNGFVFYVQASNDAHVLLQTFPGNENNQVYEIVIGGWANSRSVIRTSKQGANRVQTSHRPLSADQHLPFWITCDNGLVRVGEGSVIGERQFMSWQGPFSQIKHASVATGWGSSGNWIFAASSLTVATDTSYTYVPVPLLSLEIQAKKGFVFYVQASNDAHVLLQTFPGNENNQVYEIVIGGWSNSRSVIRTSKQGANRVQTSHRPLSADQHLPFWITCDNGLVRVGEGSVIGERQFMSWQGPFSQIKHASVATGWGSSGNWIFSSSLTSVNTDTSYTYVPVPTLTAKLTARTGFVFYAQASNDAHVLLQTFQGNENNQVYEIVIGGWANSRSVIRTSKQGANRVQTSHRPLSADQHLPFWITCDNGLVRVGEGSVIGERQFMSWQGPFSQIKHASVATGWGSSGNWIFDA